MADRSRRLAEDAKWNGVSARENSTAVIFKVKLCTFIILEKKYIIFRLSPDTMKFKYLNEWRKSPVLDFIDGLLQFSTFYQVY